MIELMKFFNGEKRIQINKKGWLYMEVHYYQFPNSVSSAVRFKEGCGIVYIDGSISYPKFFPEHKKVFIDRVGFLLSDISLERARGLLQEYGGCAWTSYLMDDGMVFNVREIRLDDW